MEIPRPADPSDRKWSEKAEELEFTALERIKTTSDKWLTTVASIGGIFTFAAFLKEPPDVSKLQPTYQFLVPVLFIIAVVCYFLSTFMAALATQGIPRRTYNTGPALRKASEEAVDKAIKNLMWSRRLIFPAAILLLFAIGMIWFGGSTKTNDSSINLLVLQETGIVYCGELTKDQDRNLLLKVDDKNIDVFKEAASFAMIDACP
jgi:hypothetical protein